MPAHVPVLVTQATDIHALDPAVLGAEAHASEERAPEVRGMVDPLEQLAPEPELRPRQRYLLEDTGFDEVPPKYRKFYRRWRGDGDVLAPNEVICPVCKVVIRSSRELRPGDRVYCMPCMSRLTVVRTEQGTLEAHVAY